MATNTADAKSVDSIPATKSHDQDSLKAEIDAQGAKVRDLKAAGVDKVTKTYFAWPFGVRHVIIM